MTQPSADIGLSALGWSDWHEQELRAAAPSEDRPARVVRREGAGIWVDTGRDCSPATVSGRIKHAVESASELPVVGDWVLIAPRAEASADAALIRRVLPRRTTLTRRRSGPKGETQLLAANVDTVLIMWALDREPNLGLLQRAVVAASAGGGEPLILLGKVDCGEGGPALAESLRASLGVPVVGLSVVSGEGLEELESRLLPAKTAALLGPSGAGKSSLVNRLLGAERMRVGVVRTGDNKGKHTTTHRELFRLPSGALLLDGPGVRELGLAQDASAVAAAFPDVAELAAACALDSCRHRSEPGCRVMQALADGSLPERRLADYRRLLAEATGDPTGRHERPHHRSPKPR
jgi:ribosome biogenesis GTPase / thiamine phosphate phosphatase